jgi:hypothetical protein
MVEQEFFTVDEIAKPLKISPDSVTRQRTSRLVILRQAYLDHWKSHIPEHPTERPEFCSQSEGHDCSIPFYDRKFVDVPFGESVSRSFHRSFVLLQSATHHSARVLGNALRAFADFLVISNQYVFHFGNDGLKFDGVSFFCS